MLAMIVSFLALVAVAQCSVVPQAPAAADYTSFAYDVADPLTGDYKNQVETRTGDIVRGQYSLLESDGTKRIVDYAADAVNGFNAVVRKDPSVTASAPARITSSPALVASRTLAAPGLFSPGTAPVAARAYGVPTVIASSPAVIAASALAAPAVVSRAPGLLAARTYGSLAQIASNPTIVAAPALAVSAATAPALRLLATPTYSSSALIASNPNIGARSYGYDPSIVSTGNVVTAPYSTGLI